MPIYEYECEACGHRFERLYMSPDDRPAEIVCSECDSSAVHRVFSPPTVHSGQATDMIEEAAEQVEKDRSSGPHVLGQGDVDETL